MVAVAIVEIPRLGHPKAFALDTEYVRVFSLMKCGYRHVAKENSLRDVNAVAVGSTRCGSTELFAAGSTAKVARVY